MPQQLIENPDLESDTTIEPLNGIFRGPRIDALATRPFPQLFEDQVNRLAEKPAVAYEDESLTFAELNARANQLARHLRSLGVGPETLVGLCIDRSLEVAVGILGILKSGGAYLPLDPEYPKERLAFMLDDARPMLVLTRSKLADRVSKTAARVVLIDRDLRNISQQGKTNVDNAPQPRDLAYVIYTSGSTGKPKGVTIEHGNLANYLLALDHELKITRDDIYLHTASIAFSSSRRQLMLPLSQGATVVIATSDERKDPLALFEMIRHRGVTIMDAVPSFWRNCTAILAALESETRRDLLDNKLRLMLSASEPLLSDIPKTWASEFRHPARHVHMFGQTETAGIVSIYRVPAEISNAKIVPIGRPIANSEIYILNEEKQPCAAGVAGELFIGGAGVGRGYLNRPELTAEKFIANPFSDQYGARLYRTGDWAKYDADGQIRFVGRRDQQVKLRGFRVELGEVETALAKHPAIRESVVIARDETNATSLTPGSPAGQPGWGGAVSEGSTTLQTEKKLIAYFVADAPAPTISELRAFLLEQLPDYQVPSGFVQLDALPLSANGKVNRLALPDPDRTRPELSAPYSAPRNEIEQRLSEIWSEVLRLDRISINDDFFELGGNSLQAAQVCSRARNHFNCDIPLRLIFERRTIALMSEGFRASEAADPNLLIASCKPAEHDGTAPLSFSQQQFWLLDQAEPNTSLYNVCTAIRIGGPLEVAKLQRAFETIVARHEILRTNFVVKEGSPVQVIAPSMKLMVNVSDLLSLPMSEHEAEVERILAREAEKPLDLASGPLLRVKVLRLGELEHILLVTIHHIICDGWSMGVLLRELTELYQASDDCQTSLPSLPIQFSDFARWQRERFQNEAVRRQMDYWKQRLADAPATLDLPTDYPRPALQTFNGAQESVVLSAPLRDSLKGLGQQEGATLFMTLLAAFQALLFRYSGQADIVVGSPIAGRTLTETENLIGAFVNTLVFRGNLSGNPTFREFLGRVRETALEAYANQEVPFEKLVAELRPERGANRTPLFQVMFVLQNTPSPNIEISGLSLRPLQLKRRTSKFDLTLQVEEEANGLRACLEYNTNLFAPVTMQSMLAHFQNLLEAVVANPAQRLSDLSFMSEAERHKLLVEWNNTGAEYSSDACIHELFEAQVEKTPQAIAAEFDSEQITYQQLNRRANQLAHYLIKQGVGPEVLVGICVERSLEMLVSIFGVLKAGGAYLPLDPTYPRERIAFMIEDANLAFIVTEQRFAKDLSSAHARLIRVDSEARIIANEPDDNPDADVASHNLAYVIYTSGSTGNPKGVEVEHRSLVNFSTGVVSDYGIEASDRILQFGSLCFDVSAEEIYPALICGATVVLRTDEMINSVRDFLRHCANWSITVMDLPTAYWHELTDALDREDLKLPVSVRLVIVGGEKALPHRLETWKRRVSNSVRFLNTYGPTETTIAVTMCDLGHEAEWRKNIPIGRPMRNTSVYVLDEFLHPVPTGVQGELYIGGAGVARGYLNRPELTAEKFITNPFVENAGARLYKTGDLVRYRHDGNLEFLGRIDNQIKIRGFRVELEEIERALRTHTQITNTVVVLREDSSGDKRLVAYVVPRPETQPAFIELRNFLKAKLPSYMLPAAFETIDALPLMPNGKVDRRALPEPQSTPQDTREAFVPPTKPIEQVLASAWRDALKLERVGIHDNFFELGGHSLLAARVVSSVRNELNVQLGMVDVLRSPTIAELAALLEERACPEEDESRLATLLQEIGQLSDEEAEQRLAEEMTNSERSVELLRV